MRTCRWTLLAVAILACRADGAQAQQATVSTPYQSLNHSFYERVGTQWGFNWRGLNAQFGGGNLAQPQFGNPNPGAGLTGGWSAQGPRGSGYFNFAAAQGSQRSATSQVPSVTVMNGRTGFVSDTSVSPFVISYIPVVGGFPTVGAVVPMPIQPPHFSPARDIGAVSPNPQIAAYRRMIEDRNRHAAERLAMGENDLPPAPVVEQPPLPAGAADGPGRAAPSGGLNLLGAGAPLSSAEPLAAGQGSSASQAVPSVADARRLREMEQTAGHDEAMALYERALTAEEGGKPQVARIYYQMVVRRASGELRRQAVERLDGLATETSYHTP